MSRMTSRVRAAICGLAALPCLGLALAVQAQVSEANEQFAGHLEDCARQSGYDLTNEAGYKDFELGLEERQYRQCAYDGVERILIPNTRIPDAYRRIVEEDRRMTDMVEAKQMTRTQRRERLDALVAELDKQEREAHEAVLDDLTRQRDDLQRQLDLMRRLDRSRPFL